MPEIDVLNLSLCFISIIAISICLLAIFQSYKRFRLRPILFYFIAFSFFLLGVLGVIPSTIILDPAEAEIIRLSQAYTFGLTFIGLFFLFLGIHCAKGSLLSVKTNVMSFIVGGTILGYLNPDFYHLTYNVTWETHYHPVFFLLISCGVLIIMVELISYVLLMRKIGTGGFKNYETLYFIGWLVLATGSGGSFLWSRIFNTVLPNLYLIFFSLGVLIISVVIFYSPASLIASPLKVFNITFSDPESGIPYLSFDFRKGEMQIEPVLFSGVVTGMSLALKDAVKGKRYLKSIDGIDRKILLERGLQAQGILTVEDETDLFRRILKRLLILFEMDFYPVLNKGKVGFNSHLYSKFIPTLEKYFAFAL